MIKYISKALFFSTFLSLHWLLLIKWQIVKDYKNSFYSFLFSSLKLQTFLYLQHLHLNVHLNKK